MADLATSPTPRMLPGYGVAVTAGYALARATNAVGDGAVGTEVDIATTTIAFTVPADRDVWVRAVVPTCGAATAAGILTVKLTDESNVQKAANSARSGTASRNHPTLVLDEVIAAGSGAVTRKLRAACTTSDGYVNLSGGSLITIDAIVR